MCAVRVATFNLHAGVDGWGRPTRAVDHAASLDADVLIVPELWRAEVDVHGVGTDLFDDLARRTGMRGLFVPLARGERVTTGVGGRTWQPLTAHLHGERGLYFSEHRSLSAAQRRRRGAHDVEHGEWGLGLLTRLPIEEIRAVPLRRLPRERVSRAVLVARLRLDDQPFHVVAVHGAHLSHGSFRQYREVRDLVASLESLPIILGGDFNSWRPPLRLFLPGWRTLVRARTWPARVPHSQIDHLLGRGPWRVHGGGASPGGSDHRALWADVTLEPVHATLA